MNRIVYIVISLLFMTSLSAQTLTERQLNLAACAALEAQGDVQRLEYAIIRVLDFGVTVNELKEAFSQLYAYTGFPRSLNALNVLKTLLENGKPSWIEGKPWVRPAQWDDAKKAYELGKKNQTIVAGQEFDYTFCPQNEQYLKSHLFGDIFAGDQLSPADRELVTVAALSALKGTEAQLASHKKGAVNMGNTPEQVDKLCSWLSENGYSQQDGASEACAGAWPKGEPNTGYAQYFIGDSHLASVHPANLGEGAETLAHYSNVTFEPGCRNNWHVHHGFHQILICVSGKGWYQEWGKEPIALLPGMIIDIPNDVKHWHGAQKDSWFQHLTTHVACGGEQSNE